MALLSKSKFLAGYQCSKRLWLQIHNPSSATAAGAATQRIFDQGHEVGELAQDQFPDGILIDDDHFHIPDALENTQLTFKRGEPIIYEPAFEFDDVLVRVDILQQLEDETWHLIEVKSSTRIKPENIQDVAIQTYVATGSGLDVSKVSLMHINRGCTFPDLSDLFTLADLTHQSNGLQPSIHTTLTSFKELLDLAEAPDISIGKHCNTPYDCPFIAHCWDGIPATSVYSIPRLSDQKRESLVADGLIELEDIPGDAPLTQTQMDYVEFHREKKVDIDTQAIAEELVTLEYPLHFLDFETDGPAVPRLDGMHPYDQFPFQFSCHVLHKDGRLEHAEYLHQKSTDPRPALGEALVTSVGENGSVIAYNAPFEKMVMVRLSDEYPDLAKALTSIIDRLWDQLIIFRRHYKDYRFKGSNGLKSVLPVLIPEMSYENMDVSQGQEAQVTWNQMIQLSDGSEKQQLVDSLLEYCRQDTFAMVKIHDLLSKLKNEV